MNRRIVTLLAIGGAGAMAFAVPGVAGSEFRNKYQNPAEAPSRDCGDGDTVTYGGPLKMWPPNHKMQNVSVTATDADGAGETTITAHPAVSDTTGGDGGTKHDPDWTPGDLVATDDGSATVDFQLRSERSGKGIGRTYTIDWEAVFDDKTCASSTDPDDELTPFTVEVPHDMRGGRDW